MADQEQARESQRRQATVVFADISGFTAMSEKLDPEDVTSIMNDCFRLVEHIVHEHGGTVDKYIGDCVMALFGAAHAVEHAARHAVMASLEIRGALEHFNVARELPVPLRVHIGVNTGLVIAGDVGGDIKRDFTVMGDTVNLAARLEDASEKGQIFVGPTTYEHTQRDFEFRKLKPLSLKGKSEAVQAYEVLEARERTGARELGGSTRQISADLVGRTRELALLDARVEALLAGEGGIVSIIGEPGIGKSRLLAELAHRRSLGALTVLVGRSDALSTQRSFHPFVDLFHGWCGIKPGEPESIGFAKLAEAVGEVLDEGSSEVLPFIATLMGMRPTGAHAERIQGIEGEALEKLVLKATRDLFAALARKRPLLLCFEDLHWADLSSVKLLESLLGLAGEQPILFLAASRPGFTETSERLSAMIRARHARNHVEIVLGPLDAREAGTLVRSLLKIDDLPATTRELIAHKAEGNPFYIEEVIRALIDQGAIEVEGGRLRVTDKVDSAPIPGTIQEVIAVRVEQLDEGARRVLQVASVIGRSFYHRLLAALVGKGPELETTLSILKERQVIEERVVRRTASARRQTLMSERQFVFRHALIQETIYDSLLKGRRKELHLRVAESIESVFADRLIDFYGMLALHYSRAESFERAESYLFLAGEEAVRAAASSEALAYFREAHRLYGVMHGDGGDPGKKLKLEKSLAQALLLTGNLSEARPHFDRALTYLGEKVARSRAQAYRQAFGDLLRILIRIYVLRGRMSTRPSTEQQREAIALLYNRARVESVADPEWFLFDSLYMTGRLTGIDPRAVEQAFAQWAGVALLFSYSGLSFDVSRRVSEVARSLLREDRSGDLLTYHLMNFMRNYFEGLWDMPSGVDDALLERVLRTGQVWDVDTFLGMDAEMQIDLGNFAAAEMRLKQIASLVVDYGYRFAESNELALTSFLALAKRKLDEALEAVERYAERPEEMLNLVALGTKAKVHLLREELDAAGATLEHAAALLARMGRATPFHSGAYRTSRLLYDVLLLEQALARQESGAIRAARRRFRQDLRPALRTAAKMARTRTETYRLIGSHHWLVGHTRRAERWWRSSLAEGERLGARPELARTHLEIARRLQMSSGGPAELCGLDAGGHLDRAQELFSKLDLAWDLDQVERLRLSRAAA